MNILGHAYVAVNAVAGDKKLLIIGSLLPESFPFIPNNPFNNEEIHEGGEKLLQFLDQNYPQKRDLALGILAHSRKFGADGFSQKLEDYVDDQKENLLKQIAEASGLDIGVAPNRLHNFLGWGLDLLILKNKPAFVKEVDESLREVEIKGCSKILSECFNKDYEEALTTFRILFKEIYRSEDLYSADGLARIWSRQAAGLSEHDKIDIEKTVVVIERSSELLKNNYEGFLELVIKTVRDNLRKYGNRK